MSITCKAIGSIYSMFHEQNADVRQARIDGKEGKIVIKEEYKKGLEGLEKFSHIIALYHFHKESEERLQVKPLFDTNKLHGVFACRYPSRPNRLGISILTLTRIEDNVIYCKDIDMLNGTPLLDIKPYVKQFDWIKEPRSGWYDDIDWDSLEQVSEEPTAVACQM